MNALCRTVVVMALLAGAAPAQAPPAETSADTPRTRVRGRVVDAQTRAPIKGAIVIIGSPGQPVATVEGEFDGSFDMADAPTGDQQITVRKSGYQGPWRRVRAPAGREVQDVRIEINRASVIAGRVLDADGAPFPYADVRLMQSKYQFGRPIYETLSWGRSDDRGMFRIWNLQPGDYLVKVVAPVMPGPRGAMVYAGTSLYYPNALTVTDAARIHLDWFQVQEEINFQLGPPAATRVDGVVSFREAGGDCKSCEAQLRRNEGGVWVEAGDVNILHDAFAMAGLPTGPYVIQVRAWDQTNGSMSYGASEFVVTEDRRSQVVVDMRGQQSVSGRVVLMDPPESISGPDAEPWHSMVQLIGIESDAFSPSNARQVADVSGTGAEAAFDVQAVPGRYRLSLYPVPGDGYIRSVTVAGRPITGPQIEVSRSGLEDVVISIAFDVGKVSGKVDMGKATVPEAGLLPRVPFVQLLPESDQTQLTDHMFGLPKLDGSFEMDGLPPGRYRALARVDQINPSELEDPTAARRLAPWSKPVEVRPGQTTSLDLKQAPSITEVE